MLLLLLISTVVGLLTYIVVKYKQRLSYWQSQGIPCDDPDWLLGSMKGVRSNRSFLEIWLSYYKKFKGTGPFAGFYWFQKPAAFILDINLVKNILIKDFNKFTDRGFYSNEKDDPLTGQLFVLDGVKWKNMRNKLSPTFTSGKMKYMFPTVTKVGQELVSALDDKLKEGDEVDVKDWSGRYTTDVIGTCAFGIDCSSVRDPTAEFPLMGRKAVSDLRYGTIGLAFLLSFPELARKLHMKQTPDDVEAFFLRIVRETVAYREKNNIRRNDFMDILLDLKNNKILKSEDGDDLTNLTLDQVAAQAFVFLVAGFETSSTTMSFALYELAQHEDIQQKVRHEINAVLENNGGEFSYECMKELQYLEQVISETLRLHSVLPILNRVSLEDYVVPGHPNYVIKKDMPVLIPAAAIHRDPEFYPNPDVFNPDHFSPELVKQRDSVEWLPFGDGPRNCVGMRFGLMQTRVGLALLLKHYRFSACPRTEIPLKYNKSTFLVASEGGVYLKMEKV